MAARPDLTGPHVAELRQLRVEDLNPVLEEQTRLWRDTLDWDFQPSAELVQRFVEMHALSGYSLIVGGRPIGYAYFVCEEHKGLIGDLYVLREFATAENENRLLSAVLDVLMKTPYVRRIEAQLMMLRTPKAGPRPGGRFLKMHDRHFMEIDLAHIDRLPEGRPVIKLLIEHWLESRQEEAAQLIAAAYVGHIDSQINDQYRSVSGARRFLLNIVQYPGCGRFFQPASYLALDAATGRLCGVSLSSRVAPDIGHITQICVSPEAKGSGTGYELLRRALQSMAAHGCKKASLTVTAANYDAITLYEQMGFRLVRKFAAYVWEGF